MRERRAAKERISSASQPPNPPFAVLGRTGYFVPNSGALVTHRYRRYRTVRCGIRKPDAELGRSNTVVAPVVREAESSSFARGITKGAPCGWRRQKQRSPTNMQIQTTEIGNRMTRSSDMIMPGMKPRAHAGPTTLSHQSRD